MIQYQRNDINDSWWQLTWLWSFGSILSANNTVFVAEALSRMWSHTSSEGTFSRRGRFAQGGNCCGAFSPLNKCILQKKFWGHYYKHPEKYCCKIKCFSWSWIYCWCYCGRQIWMPPWASDWLAKLLFGTRFRLGPCPNWRCHDSEIIYSIYLVSHRNVDLYEGCSPYLWTAVFISCW